MSPGRERRQHARFSAKGISAHLNVADLSSPCIVQDISAGGVFIQTNQTLPPGMPVAVNLARPGWNRVLRVSGRVVWALAEKTAAKRGTVPGMRIRFDPLPGESTTQLVELLEALRALEAPAPVEPAITAPKPPPLQGAKRTSGLKEKVFEAAPTDDTLKRIPVVASGSRPSARGGDEKTEPGRPPTGAEKDPGAPKLIVQVQGLLMQLGELQAHLEKRDQELEALRARLQTAESNYEKAERDRKAAELAIQRLSMQLASRR